MIKLSKGAILVKQNNDLVIDYFELPRKLKLGQVLVKIRLTGICGSQIGEITGVKGPDKYLPHLLGHEGVGEVIQKHPSVKKVKIKDRVLLHWMPSKGIDSEPPVYKWKGKPLNAGKITTFNEYAVISENRLTKISKGNVLNDIDATFLGCTASTALGSVFNVAKIKKTNSFVAVAGCGLIGQYIIKILKKLKISKVIAIEKNQKKILLIKQMGVKNCLNPSSKTFLKKIKKYQGKIKYFFECSGNIDILNLGFKLISYNGKLILIGVTKKGKLCKFNPLEINLGKKILGSKGGEFIPDHQIKIFNSIIKNNKIKNKNIIEGIFNIEEINHLIKKIQAGLINKKVLIKFK